MAGQQPCDDWTKFGGNGSIGTPRTVIGWINGSAITLPSGENSVLQGVSQNGTTAKDLTCALTFTTWLGQYNFALITPTDVVYAATWGLQNSGNSAPPATITPATQLAGGDFRIFNDFGNGKSSYQIGITPDPCKTGLIPGWVDSGQSDQYNGHSGTVSGELYQMAEGRVGLTGQLLSQEFYNASQSVSGTNVVGVTVPWIYSVIEFNSSGTPTTTTHTIFPTFSVYKNGVLQTTYPQSAATQFMILNETYELSPSQVH
jgi:hypothetical protein